jgi:hypothetical protein
MQTVVKHYMIQATVHGSLFMPLELGSIFSRRTSCIPCGLHKREKKLCINLHIVILWHSVERVEHAKWDFMKFVCACV